VTGRWVSEMLDLAAGVAAIHGVVPVMDADAVASEISLVGRSRDGVLQHPMPAEFERMSSGRNRPLIGTRYVRFPRWGTIYSHEHVEALGGRAKIDAAVKPALVRDLGAAWYFQLTEGLDTAMSAEALDKQRIFTDVAAPLLPPPILKGI